MYVLFFCILPLLFFCFDNFKENIVFVLYRITVPFLRGGDDWSSVIFGFPPRTSEVGTPFKLR